MPKDRRKYATVHEQSVRLSKRQFAVNGAAEHVQVGERANEDAENVLASMSDPHERPTLSKKEKQQLKHETFLKRLRLPTAPYSKSHVRRMKRRAREQLAGGLLQDIAEALPAVEDQDGVETRLDSQKKKASPDALDAMDTDKSILDTAKERKMQRRKADGLIGQGKDEPLSNKERKRVLQVEKLRQPLLLAAPEFTSNPFQALRLHAQNTLVKHKPETDT